MYPAPYHRLAAIIAGISVAYSCIALPAAAKETAPPAPASKATATPPPRLSGITAWGKVIGSVFDAETDKPLPDVKVTVLPPAGSGPVKDSKPLTDLTGAIGEYELKAPLGQKKSKLHWGRLFMTNVLALANPKGVTTETRFVEVSSFNVRVEKAGYQPFEGPVDVADSRPEAFRVYLSNIYLAPQGSARRSSAPEDRPRETLQSFTLTPTVVKPGEKVTFRAHLLLPNDLGINYDVSAGGFRNLIKKEVGLEQVKAKKGDGLNVYFERVVTIPKEPEDLQDRFVLTFTRDGREVYLPNAPEPLLQVIQEEADRPAAEAVARADERARTGDDAAALDLTLQAARERPSYRPASLYASRLAMRLRRWNDAAAAAKQVMDAGGVGAEEAYDTFAEASLNAGTMTGESLLQLLAPLEKKIPEKPKGKEKVWKDRAEGYWNRAMGRAALAAGDYDRAALHFGKAALRIYVPTDLMLDLRVRQAESASSKKPEFGTRWTLARALLDSGRGDEALFHFRTLAAAKPDDPWVRLDLAQTLLDEGQPEAALPELKRVAELSPENTEVQITIGEALVRLHRYADALEPLKTALERSAHNGDLRLRYGTALYASGKVEEGLEELLAGAHLMRSKPEVRDDLLPTPWGVFYDAPKKRSAAGFQTQAAQDAHRLLRAHERLEANPQDPAALLDTAIALSGLGAPEAALNRLQQLPSERRNSPAALRVQAQAQEELQQWKAARGTWRQIVTAVPEDAEARRRLAYCTAMSGSLDDATLLTLNASASSDTNTPEGRMTLWD